MNNKINEIIIEDINQYLNIIKKKQKKNDNIELLFRGQNIDKPLLPKLARLNLNGTIENIEKLMLEEFKRGIIPLSEFQPTDEWDLLSLAQHHGLPTRLLDWTYNPLIALFFAVNYPPAYENNCLQNGVIWIFSPSIDDYRTNTEKYKPLSNKITKIYRPKVISRRISAQSGVFSVHRINDNGKMISFNTNKKYKSKLTKIIIKHELFIDLKQSLNTMGINDSTVFPDLDGFCKYLEKRFSK